MMARLFDAFFGCWHSHYSFPMTIRQKNLRGNAAASVTGTYVVCLDCGKELPYDWTQMKVAAAVPGTPGSAVAALASKHAA
jgi:hypothetical protein